jgi:polynucleotide 5'-kinase involved in rRNA processing
MSSGARSRTREERRALREEAYNRYFRTAEDRVFELSTLVRLLEEGTIVGLFDRICWGDGEGEDKYGEIQGLGILRELDYERENAVVFTPVDTDTGDGATIRRIKPGGLKLIRVNGRFRKQFIKIIKCPPSFNSSLKNEKRKIKENNRQYHQHYR